MKVFRLTLMILLCGFALSMSACSNPIINGVIGSEETESTNISGTSDEASGGKPEVFTTTGLRYALLVKDLANPYWTSLVDGMQEYCDINGITLDVQGTAGDTAYEEQVAMCEAALEQKYDAIFVAPLGNTTICSFIKKCNDYEQPIFIMDSAADANTLASLGARPTATFEADNYTAGCVATEFMAQALNKKGSIAIITGNMASEAAIQINFGMQDTLDENPEILVLESQAANWNRYMSKTLTAKILRAHPNISGIMAANDEMGLGALEAVTEAGLVGKVAIVSINFMKDAQAAIKEGKMYASIDKGPYKQGRMAAEVATEYLEGEQIQDYYQIPVVGYTAKDF